MGFDETDYVYKITVDGTDILEYYDLEHRLSAGKVAEVWLSDAEANHGDYISSILEGRVNVELLTDVDEEDGTSEFEGEAIPLPPPDDND